MEEQSIIKEKLQLELSLLARDMENYYHNLLRENELLHSKEDLSTIKSAIPFNEEILKDRVDKALYLSALFLALKLKEQSVVKRENLEIDALWKILEHPLLNEAFIQEKIEELRLLKERISLLRTWNKREIAS